MVSAACGGPAGGAGCTGEGRDSPGRTRAFRMIPLFPSVRRSLEFQRDTALVPRKSSPPMCNPAHATSRSAPTATTATSPRSRTVRATRCRCRRGRKARGEEGARRAPTSTEVRHMNVPFSHPSDLYPQKDGRKVRWCCEGTFTFRTPDEHPDAAPARSPRSPGRPSPVLVSVRRLARSYLGRRGRTFNVRPRCLRYDREAAPGRIPWPSGAARWIRAAPSSSRAWWCIGRCRVCRPGCDASEIEPISTRK